MFKIMFTSLLEACTKDEMCQLFNIVMNFGVDNFKLGFVNSLKNFQIK